MIKVECNLCYTKQMMGEVKLNKNNLQQIFNGYVDKFDVINNSEHHETSPGSYLYKQNSHSVSSFLFLYDPDHHYMYKATQCWDFADCVEFYDSWGTGDNIKLDTFHRMCDELVENIRQSEEILAVDAKRFEAGENLHPDREKHILAFDIIYCATVYNLYATVNYTKRNAKEKSVYMEKKEKA